ncbi:hypothetical protein [Nitrosomonas sp. Nm58]|uniref:hypothetical protein n=1 Tax=Nitrosomonas sp. Nm58 TaxID=200126 RepID=UPI000899641E|nr:hypothetical protein [Nitrosomonas sp. Nm58]SDY39720.1 hypothetical protein SAMN05421754_100892 [Nitrosomonas sp. Nm58]
MPIDDRTVNFNLPLPSSDNFLFDDVERIRGAFAQIDHELHGLSSSLLGVGGNSASGSITLTSSSETIQSITPTESGNYVTLPDATTMNAGIPSFAIQNAGSHDLGIMDSAGKKLGWIRSGQTGIVGLVDNTAVNGVWVTVGIEKLGVTASKGFYSLTGMSSSFSMKAIAVDQNRTLILFGTTVLNAIVYDANTRSFGQPTVVIATINNSLIEGILASADKVLVLGATASDLCGVILSLSGTTIFPGPVGTRSTNIPDKMGMLVELGNSGTTFAFTQGRSSGPYAEICAISISNDTVAIGDTLALDRPTDKKSGLVLIPISESTVLSLNSDGINISAKPHSISGITVTPGSAALLTTTMPEFRWLVLPSGRVAVIYANLDKAHGAIISVTGMTASASDVVLGDYFGSSGFLSSGIATVVESGKVVVVNYSAAGSLSSNILTADSSGVAGAGTASIIQLNASPASFNIVSVSGDVISLSIGDDTSSVLINVDASGVSPVIDIVDSFSSTLSRQDFVAHAFDKDQFNYRINSLGNGSAKYAPNLTGSAVVLGYTSKRIFKVDSPVIRAMGWKTNLFGVSPSGNDLWVVSCGGPASAMIACLEAAE